MRLRPGIVGAAAAASEGETRLRILVSGSTGFVGTALVEFLFQSDAVIIRLVRDKGWVQAVEWDPARGTVDHEALERFDAVIHLAGENIARGRWTRAKRERIRESRVRGTRVLSEALASVRRRPAVLVSASAIGYYGNRGEELLVEESAPGEGFLAELCRDWEAATRPAEEAGIRVVHLRLGMVLGRRGGALARMIRPFRLGFGGTLGGGNQIMSWISVDDLVGAILHAVFTRRLAGPVNCVAPEAVSNYEFTRKLARALHRPALLLLPAPLLRLALGRMASEVLLSSAKAEPRRLLATGFRFRYPDLDSALRHLLEERRRPASMSERFLRRLRRGDAPEEGGGPR